MKNTLKTVLGFIVIFLMISVTFGFEFVAYELKEKDYKIVDRIEERIFDFLDSNSSISPERVVTVLEKYNSVQRNNQMKQGDDRVTQILDLVIDDIKYDYYLGEYSDDEIELGQDDCLEGEYFDFEEGMCYLDEQEYSDEDFGDEYSDEEFYQDENSEDEEDIRAVYSITGDSISLITGTGEAKDKEVFTMFANLIPQSFRMNLTQYKTYNKLDGDTFAYVVQDTIDKNNWHLVVNISNFYKDGKLDKKESVHTMIHEFSHVLTLGRNQVRYVEGQSDLAFERAQNTCKNIFIQEGCLNEHGYLYNFINLFWKKDFEKSQNGEENDFYTGNEKSFVTEYAASNPGEDIAESFTFFVLKPKPKEKGISNNKILFFYGYPELIKLRTVIRNRLQLLNK